LIGIIGGSGFYEFLDFPKVVATLQTIRDYGHPSESPVVGYIDGTEVAFLPRHGYDHRFPPHLIPYRANIAALKELGVTRIIAPSAVGSLKLEMKPGDFVIADQLVDRTWGRPGTFNSPFFSEQDTRIGADNITQHLSFAQPYDVQLRNVIWLACTDLGIDFHSGGTICVIQGPRFSTRAESLWYQSQGWDLVNMTQAPEAQLAAEVGIAYATIAVVTDYDFGLDTGDEPVTHSIVLEQFAKSIDSLKDVLNLVIADNFA